MIFIIFSKICSAVLFMLNENSNNTKRHNGKKRHQKCRHWTFYNKLIVHNRCPAYRVFRIQWKKTRSQCAQNFPKPSTDNTTIATIKSEQHRTEQDRKIDRIGNKARETKRWQRKKVFIRNELSTRAEGASDTQKYKCTINHWSVDNKQSTLITILFVPLKTNLFQFQFRSAEAKRVSVRACKWYSRANESVMNWEWKSKPET